MPAINDPPGVLFGDADGYGPDGRNAEGYDRHGYDADGYDREGINADGYDRYGNYYCGDCGSSPCTCGDYEEETYYGDGGVRNYFCPSFNPDITFHGAGPLYFGMELEVTASYGSQAKIAFDAIGGRTYRIGWLKSDCSVSGFELATQPMSYPYFMREFPWAMLAELSEAGCRSIASSNGMHIHVSRAGFTDITHQYRWMKLFYRNKPHIVRIGGRESDEWGSFSNGDRRRQISHLEIRKLDSQHKTVPRALLMQDIRNRYNAINVQPRDTFEIRAFASTLDPDKARARLQLAASTVEYTRTLTAHDITRHDGWEWPVFADWVKSHDTTYPQLAKVA